MAVSNAANTSANEDDIMSLNTPHPAKSTSETTSTRPEYTIHHVSPSKRTPSSKPERYPLSDTDDIMTPIQVFAYLFFPLPADTDTTPLITALKTGLSNTLSQIPILAGRVFQSDAHSTRPFALRRPEHTVELAVRHMSSSFAALQKARFPPSALDRAVLLPPGAAPSPDSMHGQRVDDENGLPCWYLQANFLHGGLILGSASHHQVADMWSCHRAFGLLARETRLAMCALNPSLTIDTNIDPDEEPPFELDLARTPYNRSSIYTRIPESEIPALFAQKHAPALSSTTASSPSDLGASLARLTPWHNLHDLLLHIPAANLSSLKKRCAPAPPAFISSYDAVSSLLYRALTRARLRAGRVAPDERTAAMHLVNVRGRSPDAKGSYFGNALAMACTAAVTVSALVGDDDEGNASTTSTPADADEDIEAPEARKEARGTTTGLARAALATRHAIQRTSLDTLRSFAELHARLGAVRAMSIVGAAQSTGVVVSSWTQMRLEEYDLGFGGPIAFRSAGMGVDGSVWLLPMRRGEGVCAWVGAPGDVLGELERDAEVRAYAEIWG